MKTSIFILPTSKYTGQRMLSKSIEYGLQQKGLKTVTFHPIFDMNLSNREIESYLLNNKIKDFVELVLRRFYEKIQDNDFAIITGLFRQSDYTHELYPLNSIVHDLNIEIIKALSSKVIITAYHGNKKLADISEEIDYFVRSLSKNVEIIGAVITKVNAPYDEDGKVSFSLTDEVITKHTNKVTKTDIQDLPIFTTKKIKLLGAIEWDHEVSYPRALDIKNNLNLTCITDVELNSRVEKVMMCSRNLDHFLEDLTPNSLIVTSADRSDILVTICLAVKKGIKIAGVILTASEYLNDNVKTLCLETAEDAGLAIFVTKNRSVNTILKLANIDFMGIPKDDYERIKKVRESIASILNIDLIVNAITKDMLNQRVMSPPAFRYHLLKIAQTAQKRIVLPESYEPRTLQAVKACYEQGIAKCVLIGDRVKINKVASMNGISLPCDIEVITLDEAAEAKYLDALMTLRSHKGLSESLARDALKNPIIVATLMLELGEVDGLVSGAEHTTADILRPALQLIKTRPDTSLVSSVFFMCMPDEVVIFADCAVNQDPTAEQLVEIAYQSAISAEKFAIEPRVAMISYSTGTSGAGAQVEKVRKATQMLQAKYPNLQVDGPLQYDAAMIESVAKQKAPNSPVAGKATVLVFPDLNTGNTVYKAVQRSANVLSIGPVLQGIKKPVNDLSRGATVDDITYTIAITAIQAI